LKRYSVVLSAMSPESHVIPEIDMAGNQTGIYRLSICMTSRNRMRLRFVLATTVVEPGDIENMGRPIAGGILFLAVTNSNSDDLEILVPDGSRSLKVTPVNSSRVISY